MKSRILALSRRAALLATILAAPALQAAPLPDDAEIQQKARQFYDQQGEWAGTFIIQRFLRQRIADSSDQHFTAHIAYQWAFQKDPSRTGTDERTFSFAWQDGQWQVTQMGENHSGRF